MQFLLLAQTDTPNVAEDARGMWDMAVEFLSTRGVDFGVNLLAAVVILIIGRWIAKWLKGLMIKMMERAKVEKTLAKFLANIGYALLLTLVIMAAVKRLGVDTTSFAAIIAAAGLAIGFALQGSLANFAAGVMLILFKPFKAGDFIEAGGTTGIVEEIHVFSTLMRTGDNRQIIVPNSGITNSTITNFSAKDTRRIDLVVGCGYGDDLKAVKQFLVDLLAADTRILKDPAAVVAVSELGESSVDFVVRPWVASGDYWDVRWDLTEKIKLGFDERGFNIPYPTRDLHVHGAMSA